MINEQASFLTNKENTPDTNIGDCVASKVIIHRYTAILMYGGVWEFQCPCGVKVRYKINELPIEDTRFPCENKDHFVIRFLDKNIESTTQ